MATDGTFEVLPKKEVIALKKEWEKLEKNLGGIKEMKKIPDAIFVVDPKKERICIQEAHTLGIKLIGIADTNCDPDELDYVIPGNDDAIRAVKLIVSKMADAVIEANQGAEMTAEEAESVAADEAVEEAVLIPEFAHPAAADDGTDQDHGNTHVAIAQALDGAAQKAGQRQLRGHQHHAHHDRQDAGVGECFPQHGPAVCPHLLFGSGLFVLQKVAHAHRPHCHTLGDEVDGAEQQAAAAPDAVHQCAAQKRAVGADRAILVNTPPCKGQPVVAQGTQAPTQPICSASEITRIDALLFSTSQLNSTRNDWMMFAGRMTLMSRSVRHLRPCALMMPLRARKKPMRVSSASWPCNVSRLEISAMIPPVFCTKKDFFVQSIRNPTGKSKDSDQFSAQRQAHHRFGTVGGVLPEHCPAAMGGGDLLHYI